MADPVGGLEQLRVQDFRNLEAVDIAPGPHTNWILGANAAGKTSLLEAIYVLSRGRSFRSRLFERVVRKGADRYAVFGRVRHGARLVAAAVERTRDTTRVRVDGQDLPSLAPLAELLPAQVLHPNSHRLLEGGPQFRRRFLDWGVFHVEPSFLENWQRYQRALRQRNAALRHGEPIQAWESDLAITGSTLDAMRATYAEHLLPLAGKYIEALLEQPGCALSYQRGWARDQTLAETLAANRESDRNRGYTFAGPHRADLRVRFDGVAAAERASRGQQKLLVSALVIAQTVLFQRRTGRRALLLVDDLPAELDAQRRARLLAALQETGAQLFISAIDPGVIPPASDARRFHVEHGRVQEMV